MFQPAKGVDNADVRYALINNSATVKRGGALIPVAGSSAIVGAGAANVLIQGVCLGIVGNAGKVLEVDSITVENDNLTDKLVKVAYLPAYIPMTYFGTLDAAAGTTSNSGGIAAFTLASDVLVDESTVTAYTTAENMQVMSLGSTGRSTTEVEVRFINTGVGYNLA